MRETGVIFDMDGVIVLTEQAHWQSWQAPAKARLIWPPPSTLSA